MLAPEAHVPGSVEYSYTLPSQQTTASIQRKQPGISRLGYAEPSHTTVGRLGAILATISGPISR